MTLISLLVLLVIVGFVAWLILQIPMAEPMKRIIIGVLVLFVVLYLLQSFGLIGTNLRLR